MCRLNNKADQLIDRLLEEYHTSYPPEKVRAVQEKAESQWFRTAPPSPLPYVMMETAIMPPEFPDDATENQRLLIAQLAAAIHRARWNDCYYPGLASGLRQATIPSFWGCTERVSSGSTSVVPALQPGADVRDLPEPGFIPGSVGYEVLETMKYFVERTGGNIPIFITDMQGPFSVAAQVYGLEDFMIALYEDPDSAHYFLQRCTDVIIDYFHKMQEICGSQLVMIHCHPMLWMPKSMGAAVSDDFLAITSPDIFREFSVPYLEQIGTAFGGLVLHSCGDMLHCAEVLNEMTTLKALNFSVTETDLEKMAQEIRKDIVLLPHNSIVSLSNLPLLSPEEHIRETGRIFRKYDRHGVCLVFDWSGKADPDQDGDTYRQASMEN